MQFSGPSGFLPAHNLSTDHHMTSDNPSLIGMKGPGITFLIGHSLFPQMMLVIIFSLPFSSFCGCSAGQCVFKTLSQVSMLSSPTRWLHFSISWFSAFTFSHAALILAPLHSRVKISSSNFLLCCYKAA